MYREMTKPHSTHLTNEMMQENAPSIFATQPHFQVSDRYGFIPTINVVDALRDIGWMPVDATQKNVRNKSKQDFTKHLVRFRRLGDDIQIGDSVVELLLTNSHDRSSGFILHAGVFRMACANGIVVADSTFQKVSVRHSKNAPGDIIEGSYSVVDEVPVIANEVESMQAINLEESERRVLAKSVVDYLTPEPEEGSQARLITKQEHIIDQMLRPKRSSDTGTDLWSTYNVLQEKAVRGGIRTLKRTEKGRLRRSTSRAIKSIDKDIKLNKALWEMAVNMKALKQAA